MSKLTNNRVFISPLMRLMLAVATLAVGSTSQNSIAQNGYQDSESIRADLLSVLELQSAIVQDIHGESAVSDSSLALIEKAINESIALTPQELETLQRFNFSLAPVIEDLQALDDATKLAAHQIKLESKLRVSEIAFACDGYIEPAGELVKPPGPCNQKNYIPDERPPGGDRDPITLTDIEYPSFPLCTQYQTVGVVAASRIAAATLDIAAAVARRVCDQIYVANGFGSNLSGFCIVSDLIYLSAKVVKENIANCQTYRVASERTVTYVRTGDLFVQSKQNTGTIAKRAHAGFRDGQDGLKEIANQVEENSRKIEQTIAIIDEVLKTMGIENDRLLDQDPDFDAQ